MKTFRAKTKNGKIVDYRVGKELDLKEIRKFFEKDYSVKKIWSEKRHVVGFLEKNGKQLFLKLSTSEGIGIMTKTEANWNEAFNKLVPRSSCFWVPQNFDSGYLRNNLFYLITDRFIGKKLGEALPHQPSQLITQNIDKLVDLTELIQSLKFRIPDCHVFSGQDFRERYLNQTKGWFNDIPKEIQEKYKLNQLLEIVEKNINQLEPKPKHGDFAPWHLIQLEIGKLGLIDGEHAMNETVQDYDICYLIQRAFGVMQNPVLAQEIIDKLQERKYDITKLKIVLASRAIGGFLDEYLALPESGHDFSWPEKLTDFVVSL
jgi:hypothetical protein